MSPGDEVRRLLDEILRLKTAHDKEVADLESHLLHDQADITKLETFKAEAEARTAEAEERSDRSEHHARELRRILAGRGEIATAKGIIAVQEDVEDVEAFGILRARARRTRLTLDAYSAKVIADHNKRHPAPAARPGVPRRGPAGAAPGTPELRTGHDSCTVCRGAHQDYSGYPCSLFHEFVDLYDEVTLHGAIFE